MNIHSKNGDKIVFAFPKNGYDYDIETAEKYLEVDKEYTVDHTIIGGSHTDVILKEIPNKSFNSVLFKDKETNEGVL